MARRALARRPDRILRPSVLLDGPEVSPTPRPRPASTASTGPTRDADGGAGVATNNADGTLSEFSRDLTSGRSPYRYDRRRCGVGAHRTRAKSLQRISLMARLGRPPGPRIQRRRLQRRAGRDRSVSEVQQLAATARDRRDGRLSVRHRRRRRARCQYTIGSDGTLTAIGTFIANGVVVQPMGIAASPEEPRCTWRTSVRGW